MFFVVLPDILHDVRITLSKVNPFAPFVVFRLNLAP
jgi:hypothetical protein